METIKTTYPAFLAIAAGLLLIAAAAYFSKDGGSAHIPLTALGVTSLLAYFASRKAAVVFWIARRDAIQTIQGGLREVAQLTRAVEKAQSAFESQTAAAIAS